MPLTREQFQQLRNKGLSTEQIAKFERGEQPQTQIQPQNKNLGLVDRIWSSLAQRGANIEQQLTSGQNPVVSGVKATAQAFGGIGDVATQAIKAVPGVGQAYQGVENVIGKGFSGVVNKLGDTKMFQEAATAPGGV